MSRSQLVAWIVLAVVAVYVAATAMEKLEDGRCQSGVTAIDCSLPKERPTRPVIVRDNETLA